MRWSHLKRGGERGEGRGEGRGGGVLWEAGQGVLVGWRHTCLKVLSKHQGIGHGWHQQVNYPMPSQLAGRRSCTFPWHMCDIACNCVVTCWQQFQPLRLELCALIWAEALQILYNMIIDMSWLQALPVELGWYVSDKVSSALFRCCIISIWYKASTVFQEPYIAGLFHLVAHKNRIYQCYRHLDGSNYINFVMSDLATKSHCVWWIFP